MCVLMCTPPATVPDDVPRRLYLVTILVSIVFYWQYLRIHMPVAWAAPSCFFIFVFGLLVRLQISSDTRLLESLRSVVFACPSLPRWPYLCRGACCHAAASCLSICASPVQQPPSCRACCHAAHFSLFLHKAHAIQSAHFSLFLHKAYAIQPAHFSRKLMPFNLRISPRLGRPTWALRILKFARLSIKKVGNSKRLGEVKFSEIAHHMLTSP